MKIGILSDTHNHRRNTEVALAALRERGAERLIHCGDLTTPEVIYLFAGWPVTFVLGNMDMARADLAAAAQQIGAAPPALTREIEGTEAGSPHREELATSHQAIVEQWTREVEALGLAVKGLWLVDWDCGDGYYCWRHPEPIWNHCVPSTRCSNRTPARLASNR